MLEVLNPLRDLSLVSIIARLMLAAVCGGLIGLERTFKGRPSGFRTHILICVGASITTMTSQYLLIYMNYYTDLARLGAQVVAGVGFIGAGAIVVTQREQVKGLTTAAGLWTSAIVGLALGCGFFEGGIYTTILIMITELLLTKLEYFIFRHSQEMNLYLEYQHGTDLETVLAMFRETGITVLSMEVTRSKSSESRYPGALFLLRLNKKVSPDGLILKLNKMEEIILAAEL